MQEHVWLFDILVVMIHGSSSLQTFCMVAPGNIAQEVARLRAYTEVAYPKM